MSYLSPVRNLSLIVENNGQTYTLAPDDIETQTWVIEYIEEANQLIQEVASRYLYGAATKQTAMMVMGELQQRLRYAFPYEEFKITMGEYPTQSRYG